MNGNDFIPVDNVYIRLDCRVERGSIEHKTWEILECRYGRVRDALLLNVLVNLFGHLVLSGQEAIEHQANGLMYFRSLLPATNPSSVDGDPSIKRFFDIQLADEEI